MIESSIHLHDPTNVHKPQWFHDRKYVTRTFPKCLTIYLLVVTFKSQSFSVFFFFSVLVKINFRGAMQFKYHQKINHLLCMYMILKLFDQQITCRWTHPPHRCNVWSNINAYIHSLVHPLNLIERGSSKANPRTKSLAPSLTSNK